MKTAIRELASDVREFVSDPLDVAGFLCAAIFIVCGLLLAYGCGQ